MRSNRSRAWQVAAAFALISVVAAPPAALAKKKKKPLPATPVATAGATQPDKELYDKALYSIKHGRYDVARLQLQALLNTYPDSEYQMRAKLAIGDSWYREGGTAALTQAESEYKDFITFFPTAPEAAEAQMRVADIYYRQMEKPDRDYSKTERAEQEYRLMIQQFPDSPLVPRARQRLREVQEVLAERQYEIGYFYTGRLNWSAAIARYQTVVDTYPLYSKADLTLVGLGDAYAAQARYIAGMKGPEAIKAKLMKVYNDKAAAEYDRVLTNYPAAPNAVVARDRLVGMHRPIPRPTAAALAESVAEQQSRAPVTLTSRALLLVNHRPQTLESARVGEPDMDPPKPTLAPDILKQSQALFASVNPPQPVKTETPEAGGPPRDDSGTGSAGDTGSSSGAGSAGAGSAGISSGLTIVAPSAGSTETAPTPVPPTPAAAATETPAVTKPIGGLAPVKAPDNSVPAIEKPAEAPDQVNEVRNNTQPAPAKATGKKPKRSKEDKGDESSNKDKKKKGLSKLNPF